jgi:hypothetical protein
MSQLDAMLSRLTQVKGRNGNYVACCPAHEDRKPSLAVKEEDGKIILHCFAGCSVENIVGAVGMDMTDLFPPKEKVDYARPAPKVKFFATDLLRVIALEAAIVSVAAYDMSKGKTLPQHDLDRLQVAYQRINTAMESANG